MQHVAARAVISGRVQGVAFRAWTRDQAEARGLAGWVRNLADGTVEAEFIGPEKAVRDVLALCRQGPLHARVAEVAVAWLAELPEGREFRIRR